MSRPTSCLLAWLNIVIAVLAAPPLVHAQTPAPAAAVPVSAANGPDFTFAERANATLLRARKLIDNFFEQTSNVVCTESVSQTIVGKSNKPMYREESVFEYQMQSSTRSGALRVTESRDSLKSAFRDPYKTLLITNGFASMLLVLHENYEASYTFEPVAEEMLDGRTTLNFYFKPVPGASSPAAIQLSGRNYPLPLKGDIWIDEESAAVVKLVSSLDSNLEDVGLRDLRTEIHYDIVQFHSPEESYWMPTSAVINVETPKQHWRNVHRFTGYRRFRATIQVDLGGKQP
jgi:hypothetical protein